mgnify:CR=1 FL=1
MDKIQNIEIKEFKKVIIKIKIKKEMEFFGTKTKKKWSFLG